MREWVTVLRAADAAARWHVHQRRKGSAQEPYINHLLEVASFIAEATHGKDPDLVIAALLHDAIEDQEVPYELITRELGKRVADVVKQVTDDKTLPKEVRKEKQIKMASKKSIDAKIIKLADKTSNMRAITLAQLRIGQSSDAWNISAGRERSLQDFVGRRPGWKSNLIMLRPRLNARSRSEGQALTREGY